LFDLKNINNPVRLTIIFLLCLGFTSHAIALESKIFSDKIVKGSASINLFDSITASDLEQYRLDAGNRLLFAVDINENASGSEKSTSQGVTLKSVKLVLTMDYTTQKEFTDFSTETQAILIEDTGDPETLPTTFFTLLGDVGSNRITTGNTTLDNFDSVLTVYNITEPLAGATAAVLEIELLVTDPSLGDPEAFYNFNNGFEDVAIVVQTDAEILNELAPGQDEAPTVILSNPPEDTSSVIVSWLDFPSTTGYYWVAYEDRFPDKGDYDFNDLVVPYRVRFGLNDLNQVLTITGTVYLVARGAGYDHDWRLRIQLPVTTAGTIQSTLNFPPDSSKPPVENGPDSFNGAIDLVAFAGTRTLFSDPESPYVNTVRDRPFIQGPKLEFRADMDTPVALDDIEPAPFDPYLVVDDNLDVRKYEIHLIGKSPVLPDNRNTYEGITTFEDPNGYPFAMIISEDWNFPLERNDLGIAFPDFIDFALSSGSKNLGWYAFPSIHNVRSFSRNDWLW